MNITLNAIDFFIYEKLRDNSSPQELWLYRSFAALVLFVSVIILFVISFRSNGLILSEFRLVISLLGAFIVLFLFKSGSHFQLVVHTFCALIFLVLAQDVIDNGLILSERNMFLVFPPIISFVFGGIRNAAIWISVVVFALIFFYLETEHYINFIPTSSPYNNAAFCLLITIETTIFILGLTSVIFRSKSIIINQLAINENQLMQKAGELAEKTIELEKLKSDLEIRNEYLNKYASLTAHDLKQPLRTITNLAELLKDELKGLDSNESKEYLNFIISGGIAMEDQVDKILEITNLSKEISFTSLETRDLICQTINMLNNQITGTNAQIEVKEMPSTIVANEVSIKKVFQNLISNGIKYNNKENIKIEISGKETPFEWQFVVKDNGKGINKNLQKQIFNFGEQVESQYEGSGVGLNICKRLVNLHKGKIWVISDLNKGAAFYFSIRKDLQIL